MVSLEIFLQVKIDELVKPRKAIKDYRTDITGISPGDLDGVSCSLADVQVFVVLFLMRMVYSSLNMYDRMFFVQIVEIHHKIAFTWKNYFGWPQSEQ